jgi:hypothetical protein
MSTEPQSQTCYEYLLKQTSNGLFAADDLLAVILPLMEQVQKNHEQGQVAPLDGLNKLQVNYRHIYFEDHERLAPKLNLEKLKELQAEASSSFRVVGEANETLDMDEGTIERQDLNLNENDEEIKRLVYLPAYRSWEHAVGHHDALTDIYSLGIILASFALGMDLGDRAQLKYFSDNRNNLFLINPALNPVIAGIIVRMTELNRHERAQDLLLLVQSLKNYRSQDLDKDVDYSDYAGFNEANVEGKREIIQSYLCKKLFEISKRNRLLFYKETLSHLNLTQASVPIMLDYKNIKSEQLFLWHEDLASKLFSNKGLDLNLYLRFEDTPYLPGTLDKIRLQANRDIKEYGFAQLRLVIVFLHWHNLKEEKETRIQSPLLLLPVTITKKKGISDAYILKAQDTEAEVNPVLKHQLQELYSLDLPDSVDLADADLNQFYELIKQKIHNSEKAVIFNKGEKPKIELIHAKAKQRLNTYRKRARLSGKGVRFMGDLDYSYQPGNFQPLGLQMFLRKVRPAASPFANFLDDRPAPRLPQMTGGSASDLEPIPVMEKERELYRMKEEETNPFVWSFDMCSLTLANFNYRKMSLVQDYRSFLDDELENPAFDELFSLNPKPQSKAGNRSLDFEKSYFIVPTDRSQMNAVLQAKEGFSYIIQGPPGTGKSQTITNLIADYAARGKRVLFVCEKRAAIDVVYHRLHQAGLEELSCLIHDSQTDKKAFVMDVKKTYESFISDKKDEGLEAEREQLASDLAAHLQRLKVFTSTISSSEEGKASLFDILNHMISLSEFKVEIAEKDKEKLPDYDFWQAQKERIEALDNALKEYNYPVIWSQFPFRNINAKISCEAKPLNVIAELSGVLKSFFSDLKELEELRPDFFELCVDFSDLKNLLKFCQQSEELGARSLLGLLDGNSHISRSLRSMFKDFEKSEDKLKEAQEKTIHWQNKLELRDAESALSQAINFDAGIFRFVMPSYWNLRKVIKASYNFAAHAIKPRWVDILRELIEEHKCLKSLTRIKEKIAEGYGFEDIGETDSLLKELRGDMTGSLKEWKSFLCTSEGAITFVAKAASLFRQLGDIEKNFSRLLFGWQDFSCQELEKLVERAGECDHDDLYILSEFNKQDEKVQTCLHEFNLHNDQLTWAIAENNYETLCRKDKDFDRFTYKKMASLRESFAKKFKKWQELNGAYILHKVKERFSEHYRISETPVSQLTESSDKELRSLYRAGRKELEHEFGKSMRYKSIRSLAAGETSIVLRDLKPIWLMSPLSVSDTLPLKIDEFDVVIFDEASQIQLEESIPALYRSPQIIVVGDEKQLPPTNFFSSRSGNEDQSVFIEEAGESYEYDLNADSFLTQSARTLPSTMLMWHYRSRFEKLISFSNEAFYEGRLLTIPDRSVEGRSSQEIVVKNESSEIDIHRDILKRSISFHYLEQGIYEKRKNTSEAKYIAQLVREILVEDSGLSVGIVAFSEAQQGEVEEALNRLGVEDKEFKNKLEAEMEREEDEQFIGLFVKNLENVQGDERDIIILSVCYGYDRTGKMRMNFGPINKSGGEKRLNVIFSRSKRHMVVVSSIKGVAITNTYNDGANCLKNYLDYSEAVSMGDEQQIENVLSRLYSHFGNEGYNAELSSAAKQLASSLEARGWQVDRQLGQSRFRCDLAIRQPGRDKYSLAIVFDHYAKTQDTLEDFLLKPMVLKAFDWDYEFILIKDWHENSDAIIEKIESRLAV